METMYMAVQLDSEAWAGSTYILHTSVQSSSSNAFTALCSDKVSRQSSEYLSPPFPAGRSMRESSGVPVAMTIECTIRGCVIIRDHAFGKRGSLRPASLPPSEKLDFKHRRMMVVGNTEGLSRVPQSPTLRLPLCMR